MPQTRFAVKHRFSTRSLDCQVVDVPQTSWSVDDYGASIVGYDAES